jgi:hypothetical protein
MEPRLDAEVETLNTAISNEVTARTNADTNLQNQINDIRQTSRVYVKNGSTPLTKGTPVYITGADGTNVIIGAASNASEATSSKVIGLTETDLTANAMGYVVTDGRLVNIDTSAAGAAGDAVWLGVNGGKVYGLSNKPVAPAHMVYLGVVSRKNANTGEIEVKVQNGFELEELHNVSINSGTLSNGQALTYDSSSQLWKNSTPVNALSGLSDVTITSPTGGQVIKYNAGTSKWVNGAAAGGVTASDTAPSLSTAAAGDAWFDTNDGTLYVCYVDVDSTKQWVQVQANSALEGSILARLGSLESQAIAFGQMSPNYIINGAFDFWQRGTSFSASGYTADRWTGDFVTGAGTVSQQAFTPGTAPVANIEGTFFLRRSVTTGAQFSSLIHRIEDVRTLEGRTATLSFWAKGTNPTGNFNVNLLQNFGSGGSTQVGVGDQALVLTSSWTRYSYTFNIPNIAGKTVGAGSHLWLSIYQAAANTSASTLDIWGVQLEAGSVATSFRRNAANIQAELSACQRYYQVSNGPFPLQVSDGSLKTAAVRFIPEMRTTPTFTWTSSASVATNSVNNKQWWGYTFTTGERYLDSWIASAEL